LGKNSTLYIEGGISESFVIKENAYMEIPFDITL